MEILGVDFSGARPDNNTWVARGRLDGNELVLDDCRPVSRSQLASLLEALPAETVASLDFPFSVPVDFARYWMPEARTMPDLWDAAAAMTLEEFFSLRDTYVARWGEPKRLGDSYHPESYSCLHKVNPNMVPMTFYGMRMLAELWPKGCEVPPLALQKMGKVVLLEAMPGAALKVFKLPYKGYKGGRDALDKRIQILQGLARRSGIGLPNLAEFRDQCLGSHDCLDAVVAAVIAALWCTNIDQFRHPEPASLDIPNPAAALEGWLYAPVYIPAYTG